MKRFFSLLGLAVLLAATGCRKDDSIACAPTTVPTPPQPTPPSPATSNLSVAEFTRRNSLPPHYYHIALNQIQTIPTQGGGTLTFPANYFASSSGAPASDSASVRLRELYRVSDMVLADMPTNTAGNSQLLISSGQFNIQVHQAATRLVAINGAATLPVLLSPKPNGQDSTQQQQLWQRPVVPGTVPGWQAPTAVQALARFYQATIPPDSVGWLGIAHLWPAYAAGSLTTLVVATPATAAGETRVYVRPVGATALLRLTATGRDETHWQATLPLGASMQVIVLQSIAGQLYFGTQQFTVQSAGSLTPALTAVSEAEAVRLIQQL